MNPLGVVVAGRASSWRDHDWQLVHEEPRDLALQMALDEVLAREVAAGAARTLRIWEWAAPAARAHAGSLTAGELRAAGELARTKFTSSQRTARVP